MIKEKKKYKFTPDYAIPPGETLKETMESLGMSQKELSIRAGLTVQSINRIFKGEQPINYETANRLELVTNTPARFWNNLELKYREQLEKLKGLERLNKDIEWLNSMPVKELVQRGLINDSKVKTELLHELLKFFGVSSVDVWKKIWTEPKIAARRSACFASRPEHAAAWIRMGEVIAKDIDCKPFDKTLFKTSLQNIRNLTTKSPEKFVPEMRELCAQAGVALTLVPEIKKVPWNGATKWLNSNKAMIIVNLRGKGEDKFWFSFFHEAGHVINDSKKELYINDDGNDPVEKKANEFAANILFPDNSRNEIPYLNTKAKIYNFAQKINLSPGIVAGQYQFLTQKWHWYHGLVRKFVWEN